MTTGGAEDAYRKATRLMVELLESESSSDRNRAVMASLLEKYGNLLRSKSVYVAAEWAAEESVRLRSQVVTHNPQDTQSRLALAHALNQMASLEGETGALSKAVADSRHALEIVQALGSATDVPRPDLAVLDQDLASIYINMGKWLQLGDKFVEAEEVFGKAMQLLNRLESRGAKNVGDAGVDHSLPGHAGRTVRALPAGARRRRYSSSRR